MIEFQPFPKVPRLEREVVITEKIDGTNASVWVEACSHQGQYEAENGEPLAYEMAPNADGLIGLFAIRAGSRKRFITPGKETDNFGFARWVQEHSADLVHLGPGVHYGEWWGMGIQRGYGLDHKRFSLFNAGRWIDQHDGPGAPVYGDHVAPMCCHVVPVLYRGPLALRDWDLSKDLASDRAMRVLNQVGSRAAPGFMNPEGIMVYHTAARQMFKRTFEHDDNGKEAA